MNSVIKFQDQWHFKKYQGLPWWRSGWESACQCRGHGFEPWSGRIPHATEQLSPWAATTEPARLEPVLCNKRGRDSERPAHRDEEWPPLAATRESPRTETKTQHSHKIKIKKKYQEINILERHFYHVTFGQKPSEVLQCSGNQVSFIYSIVLVSISLLDAKP